jgi:signal transduction histidine kinase
VTPAAPAAYEELEPLAREQAELRRELAAAAVENALTRQELRRVRAEVMASRAGIVAAVDEARRRIERDLHDGAQHQLVALALRLRVAQASVPPALGELRAELGQVAAALTGTVTELREYARGIHPAILAERGLAPALKGLARRSPVPVELEVRTTARFPEPVEVAAYYVVSEALTNTAKHANATVVRVAVGLADGIVQVSIRDDGVGGADPARGSGLAGLSDRVEAIGGTLIVHSRPGQGTRLIAELPANGRTTAKPTQPASHHPFDQSIRPPCGVLSSPLARPGARLQPVEDGRGRVGADPGGAGRDHRQCRGGGMDPPGGLHP